MKRGLLGVLGLALILVLWCGTVLADLNDPVPKITPTAVPTVPFVQAQ